MMKYIQAFIFADATDIYPVGTWLRNTLSPAIDDATTSVHKAAQDANHDWNSNAGGLFATRMRDVKPLMNSLRQDIDDLADELDSYADDVADAWRKLVRAQNDAAAAGLDVSLDESALTGRHPDNKLIWAPDPLGLRPDIPGTGATTQQSADHDAYIALENKWIAYRAAKHTVEAAVASVTTSAHALDRFVEQRITFIDVYNFVSAKAIGANALSSVLINRANRLRAEYRRIMRVGHIKAGMAEGMLAAARAQRRATLLSRWARWGKWLGRGSLVLTVGVAIWDVYQGKPGGRVAAGLAGTILAGTGAAAIVGSLVAAGPVASAVVVGVVSAGAGIVGTWAAQEAYDRFMPDSAKKSIDNAIDNAKDSVGDAVEKTKDTAENVVKKGTEKVKGLVKNLTPSFP